MRLTHYDEHKKRWQINNDYGAVMIDELNYAVGEAIDKLAAYEDMNLTPEEFHESVAFVLELNKKLKPYMDAEEQGLLVQLPCKVGDTVYEVVKKRIDITGYRMEWGWETVVEAVKFRMGMTDSVGKTVFLTREEAEAAMMKGEADEKSGRNRRA